MDGTSALQILETNKPINLTDIMRFCVFLHK
jgi:hypothetical protein